MNDFVDETEILKEVLKLKDKDLSTLTNKLNPVYDLFSQGLNDINISNNKYPQYFIRVLDFSLILYIEVISIIENNHIEINNKIRSLTKNQNEYVTILSWLFNSFVKYILAYRKLYNSGFISQSNIILRSGIELSELIVAILYKPELFDKYIEYSKLLVEENDSVSKIWYKYLKPSKIRKVLYEFEKEVSSLETNIYKKREHYYDYISKDVHNELIALNSPQPLESLTIILYYCFTFTLQINYLLQNTYNLKFSKNEEIQDYILHLKVFYLLFEKFIEAKKKLNSCAIINV